MHTSNIPGDCSQEQWIQAPVTIHPPFPGIELLINTVINISPYTNVPSHEHVSEMHYTVAHSIFWHSTAPLSRCAGKLREGDGCGKGKKKWQGTKPGMKSNSKGCYVDSPWNTTCTQVLNIWWWDDSTLDYFNCIQELAVQGFKTASCWTTSETAKWQILVTRWTHQWRCKHLTVSEVTLS